MKKHIGLAAIAILAAGIASASAQETYSTWSKHRDVFLNTTNTGGGANVTNNVTNFPVLIRFTAKDSVFGQALAGGADLRFTKVGDAVRLKHQIDTWDTATKTAAVWVLVDTVYGNNKTQKIRLHWGKADVADSSSGTAVFANGYTNVWHLGNAAGVTPRPNAISGGNPATPVNFDPAYAPAAGLIGKAEVLTGGPGSSALSNTHLSLGTITTDYSNGFTFSAWLNPDDIGSGTTFYTASEGTGSNGAGMIIAGIQGGTGAKFRQRNSGTANVGIIVNNGGTEFADYIPGNWNHVVYSLGTDLVGKIYVNGLLVISGAGSPVFAAFSNAARTVNQLGSTLQHMNYADDTFMGKYDEARLANVSRSDDWVKLEYENQKAAHGLAYFDSANVPVVSLASRAAAKREFSVKASAQGLVFQVGEYSGSARLTLVDMWGRTVWKSAFAAGSQRLAWNGRTVAGSTAAPGLYLARVELLDKQGRTVGTQELKVPLTR